MPTYNIFPNHLLSQYTLLYCVYCVGMCLPIGIFHVCLPICMWTVLCDGRYVCCVCMPMYALYVHLLECPFCLCACLQSPLLTCVLICACLYAHCVYLAICTQGMHFLNLLLDLLTMSPLHCLWAQVRQPLQSTKILSGVAVLHKLLKGIQTTWGSGLYGNSDLVCQGWGKASTFLMCDLYC